ncbi:hypothetical protein ACKI1J_16900 [Streptomyces scabiei]|uniref:DUF3885 domain-containing protein n=1 Tax=Streptomyces scabiei TaxID=1930 RepID=UPI0038F7BCC5
MVTVDWSDTPTGPPGCSTPRPTLHPDSIRWWTESDQDDPDPEFHTHTRLYADRHRWNRGCVDGLLRAAADEALVEVFIADTELRCIHHPYDGGADVVLATPAERDRVRDRHTDWLSSPATRPASENRSDSRLRPTPSGPGTLLDGLSGGVHSSETVPPHEIDTADADRLGTAAQDQKINGHLSRPSPR